MPVADEARSLLDRVQSDLARAASYYLNSARAWRLIQALVREGRHVDVFDVDSEKKADQEVIDTLSQQYVAEDLARATLERFVAILEDFLVNIQRLLLTDRPEKLSAKMMSLGDILSLPDKTAIVGRFIDRELRDFAYEKPEDWFRQLESSEKLGCPTKEEISQIAEAKARRDILVHNRGVANWVYAQKSGNLAAYGEGESVEVPASYLGDLGRLISKVLQDMTQAIVEKHSRATSPPT